MVNTLHLPNNGFRTASGNELTKEYHSSLFILAPGRERVKERERKRRETRREGERWKLLLGGAV
jgi:hypothetical protein